MLYSRHASSARAAARSLGASRSDVDDLVAEAFTRVLSALHRGAGPEVAFRPYLMTCVRNAWYDKARKDGRVDVPGDVPEDINLALLNVPPDSEDARMVAAAFASLPERWQMVLWHTEVEGRPAAEVGPLLGLAPNAVAASPTGPGRACARPTSRRTSSSRPPTPAATPSPSSAPTCVTACRRATGARSTST